MAHCVGIDCGLRQGLLEDAKLWSTSLKDLLASSDGREEFKEFLLSCDLDDEAVNFWERCNEIVWEHQQLKKTTSSTGQYNCNAASTLISNATTVFEDYVDNCLVNLDEQMIHRLSNALASKNPDKIAEVFQDAKGSAHNLLKEIHSSFAAELVKKYNLDKT